jgi:serine/threonine-protein kinase RsbW
MTMQTPSSKESLMRPERHLEAAISQSLQPNTNNGSLRLIIPASDLSVRCGLQSIRSGIERLQLSDDALSTIELVIAEVLNNIVEHAYKGPAKGMIEVDLMFEDSSIHCTITDDGDPMPNGQLPDGAPRDLTGDLADLPEGGFGWFLIRQLTTNLHYGRQDNRNVLTCRIMVENI